MVGLSSDMFSRAAGALRGWGLLGDDDTQEADVPAKAEQLGLLGRVANQNGVGATYEPDAEFLASLEHMRVNGPPPRSNQGGATYDLEPGVWEGIRDRFENRASSPDSRWGEDASEIEARLRGANAGWHVGQGAGADAGTRGMMPGLSQGGQIVAGGQRPDISPASTADDRWGEDRETIEATLRGRNAGWQVDQKGGTAQDGSRGMMPGLSPGGRIAAAGKTVMDYASQGGPFRPEGPLGGVAQNVAEGLVNFPRAMGFSGTNAQQDINNFASMAPTPMAGMGGPRMSGAGVGGRAAAAPISMRAAPPPGMVHEQSRLDDDGNQWMTDPSTGAEINLTEMENSANRYLQQGGDLPPNTDDVPGRVAEHFRRTSKGIQEMPQIYKDMGMDFDMAEHIRDIERGYHQNAAAYLPESAEVYVQGDRLKFVDPNPGEAFHQQTAQRQQGHATITPQNSNTWTPINREAPAGVSRKQILDKMQGQGIPKEQAERMAGTQRSVDWYNGKGELVPHAADSKGISLNGIRDFTKMNRGEIVNGLMSQGVKQEDAIAIVKKNLDNPSLHDYKKMQSAIEAFNNLPKVSEAADMLITRGGK